MSNEGPTTVGSIIAKLKIDDSDWNRELNEAETKARALGAVDPTIKVEAKVDEAIAKLSAVGLAQSKLEMATDRLKLAYQRLDEVQASGTAKQSTVMAAHLAAARAEQAHAKATRDLAEAQLAEAAATDVETAAVERSNRANGRRLAHWQVIALLIGALIPLLAPLAGYAVGVAGALGGMGAAGVFAIVGIKKAMKDGTAEGAQYASGLRSLKADMDSLAGTAAVNMVRWFRQAVAQVSAEMPSLNSGVRVFSNLLGSAGNHTLSAVLTALRVMNPLLVTGGIYVDRLAAGFEGWTKDGGLQQFTDYAIQQLPIVARDLGEIVTAALHIIEATAPIGTVVLGIFTALAQLLNFFPTDVLTAIAVGAIAVAIGFKTWGPITGIVTSVTAALQGASLAAAGLPGIIVAAALAVDGLAIAGGRAAASGFFELIGQSKNVDDYALAIRRGDIDINNLGSTVKLVGGFWNDMSKNLDFTGTGATHAYEEMSRLDQAIAQASPADLVASYEQLVAEGKNVGKSTEDIANSFPLATAAYLAAKAAAEGSSVATNTLAAGFDRLEGKAAGASLEVEGLADRVREFASATLDARDSQRGFESAVDAVGEGLQSQRDAYELANGTLDGFVASLDIGTEAGRQNEASLDAIATAAQRAAADLYTQTGSQDLATGAIQRGRDSLIEQLAQFGITGEAANAYADSIGLVPADVVTALKLLGIAENEKLLDAFVAKYEGKEITMKMFLESSGGNVAAAAAGARLTSYGLAWAAAHADGGTVGGFGTSRSDSNLVRLSRGEEVTRESSASAPGVRPLLKALNANPTQTMAALANSGGGRGDVSQTNHIYEATNARQVAQYTRADLIALGA